MKKTGHEKSRDTVPLNCCDNDISLYNTSTIAMLPLEPYLHVLTLHLKRSKCMHIFGPQLNDSNIRE
jgi:hypothetical protein